MGASTSGAAGCEGAECCGEGADEDAEIQCLEAVFARHGLRLEDYGTGGALHLRDLAHELRLGLSDLTVDEQADTLLRSVALAEVSIRAPARHLACGSMVLMHEEQLLNDGRRRPREQRLHVRLRWGEVPGEDIAQRALCTRLGLDEEAANAVVAAAASSASSSTARCVVKDEQMATSSSFPGLRTRYCIHRVPLDLDEDALADVCAENDAVAEALSRIGLPSGRPFFTVDGLTNGVSSCSSSSSSSAVGRRLNFWTWAPSGEGISRRKDRIPSVGGMSVATVDAVRSRSSVSFADDDNEESDQLTGIEQANRDITEVIQAIEAQKAALAEHESQIEEELTVCQDRLRAVLDRLSDADQLTSINVEKSLRERRMSRDLRRFISKNFDSGSSFELSPTTLCSPAWVRCAGSSMKGVRSRCRSEGPVSLREAGVLPLTSEGIGRIGSGRRKSAPDAGLRHDLELSYLEAQGGIQPSESTRARCPSSQAYSGARAFAGSQSCPLGIFQGGKSREGRHARFSTDTIKDAEENNIGVGDSLHVRGSPSSTASSSVDGVSTRLRSSPEAPIDLREEVASLQSSGADQNWVLDALSLHERTRERALLVVAEVLVIPHAGEFGSSERNMRAFTRILHSRYEENPNSFHNEAHASVVAHSTQWLAARSRAWAGSPPWERVATSIAALSHDVGHFGRNNAFCANSGHNLAMLYNDRSVLENMHASTACQLMQADGSNIVRNCSPELKRQLREHVVDLILATDMSSHFEFLGKFRSRKPNPEFVPEENAKDRQLVLQCAVKAADLGHAALPWDMHERWALRLLVEFYEQGDEERMLGLAVSPMCERSGNVQEFRESQKGFLQFVILPLFKELSCVTMPEVSDTCVSRIETNVELWVTGEASEELASIIEAERPMLTMDDMSPQSTRSCPVSDVRAARLQQRTSPERIARGRQTTPNLPCLSASKYSRS